jgi:uncharacterized RmlC-like cupin family protein
MSKSAAGSVQIIRPGKTYIGKQGFSYGAGASTETVGAKQICMNVLPMPSGAKAKVHYHKDIETIAYLLEGECAVYYGDELEYRVTARAGDQVYLPKMFPTPRTIRARHSANGLWFIHLAVIRMASFCCQSWIFCSQKNSEP